MLQLAKVSRGLPEPVLFGNGVVINVRPLNSIEVDGAQAEAARTLRAMREGGVAMQDIGIDVPTILADPVLSIGLDYYVFTIEAGVLSIDSWEGIGDEDGNPVLPSRETITLLFADPRIRDRCHAVAMRGVHKVRAEGNGLPVSRSGEPEAGEPTATTAGSSTSHAPADAAAPTASDAPRSSTPLTPEKDAQS